ncbi:lysozyme [Mixta intestinalis]|uniref:Lysozyme n=1 Tax=Mixta intestinalis TaxID=1615494 RepID=A0A6P1PXK5_9GAMM|nr:lysozyme [Mixta intestinalis]QHM71296.1 Lysozyme RrrD [Mixta intestinalis]
MQIGKRGIALIKQFESCELMAYRCPAGILTIGYGHTYDVRAGDTCTPRQAELWLTEDCQVAELTIESNVTVPLNQNQFDALVSFVFNLGAGNFVKSTLLKKLNAGDYTGAAAEFDRWVNAGGRKLPGLVKRRAAEKALFLS